MSIEELIRNNKGTVVDVRTIAEYSEGHVPHSINIPVQELDTQLTKIRTLTQPLILCCASGGRSGFATEILAKKGFECYNAGSWMNVNYIKTNA